MFLHKTPSFIQRVYPSLTWRVSARQKTVYLTFDDGPVPEVTPWVLKQLEIFRAKATFFCVGENIIKHPEVFAQVVDAGHAVGNHTYNHLNGWKTSLEDYLDNVRKASEVLGEVKEGQKLFRPPYGRITRRQLKALADFRIIMWEVLSGDFSQNKSPEESLRKTLRHTKPGTIVVFHDSLKSFRNLQQILPAYLETLSGQGYKFERL